jgi:hypothetical protein
VGELLVDEVGEVTTIVEDHVEGLAVGEGSETLLNTPDVLLFGLTLPGEDRNTGGSNRSGGVVLSRENVLWRGVSFAHRNEANRVRKRTR